MPTTDELAQAGRAKGVVMRINTASAHPIYRRQMPMKPLHREAYQALVKELLDANAIEPCQSDWNSNTLLIEKPGTDTFRIVHNYRDLNVHTQRHINEEEPISEQLRRLAGTDRDAPRFFFKSDLKKSFFQLSLHPDDADKTAFTDPNGNQYRYMVSAMGLRNSPATLGQFLRRILRPCQSYLVIQVDDLAIFANSLEELEQRAHTLISILAEHNILLSPAKTQGGLRHMTFAGYDVSPGSYHIEKSKTEAIASWAVPSTRKELASFLGFAQWLGPFVPRFELGVAPLRAAMKRVHYDKDAVNLTSEERTAFESIKAALVQAPELGMFDPSLPLVLTMDACETSGGSVLTQQDRILAYHSFTMDSSQRRYSVREKELLSLLQASRRYHAMFATAFQIVVYTDHQSLGHIFTTRAQTADRLMRWANHLSQYSISIVYRPGRDMQGIDALSRVLNQQRHAAAPGDVSTIAGTTGPTALLAAVQAAKSLTPTSPTPPPSYARATRSSTRNGTAPPAAPAPRPTLAKTPPTVPPAAPTPRPTPAGPTTAPQAAPAPRPIPAVSPSALPAAPTPQPIPAVSPTALPAAPTPQPIPAVSPSALPAAPTSTLATPAPPIPASNTTPVGTWDNLPIPDAWANDVAKGYEDDKYFKDILLLLNPAGKSTTVISGKTRSRAKGLSIDTNGLIWSSWANYPRRLAIPSGPIRDFILLYAHESLTHASAANMTAQLEQVYFIPSLAEACATLTAKCHTCYTSRAMNKAIGFHARYDEPSNPFHTVSMDVATGLQFHPLPRDEGYDAILVLKDELTGYTIYAPTSMSASTKDIIRTIDMFLIRDHGYPAIIQCDQQSTFMSGEFTKFLTDNGIKRKESTIEHHQAAVESAINVLRVQMRVSTDSIGLGWVAALPRCQLSTNRAISQRGEPNPTSPAMKLFGFQPAIPFLNPKTGIRGLTPTESSNPATTTGRTSIISMMDTYRETRAISANQHDKGRVENKIVVGSFVAVPSRLANIAVTSFEDSRSNKSRAIYVGPFKVTRADRGENFTIDMGDGTFSTFHTSQLKLLPPSAGLVEPDFDQPKSLLWANGKPKIRIIDRVRNRRGGPQYLVHFWGQHHDQGLWTSESDINIGDKDKILAFKTRQRAGIPSFHKGKLVLDTSRPPTYPFQRTDINDPSS